MGHSFQTDVVFDECQITRGVRPLTRHGWVIIRRNGSITLLGTKGDLIDSAHVSATTARPIPIPGARAVALIIAGRTYIVTPRWGSRGRPTSAARAGLTASQTLLAAVT
ncbi:MAG: hypothetical protein JWR52_577 [Marmoricola sp.]|nr:hypothetical protein [Marmoricola sp.]